jgi:thiol-disulfide isomerase/thioredoxin
MSAVTSFFPVNSVFGKDYKLVDLRTHCKGKKVGLLFSAYWCKPCREMTPEIIKYYEENKGGKEFEIIYVSTDVNEVAFNTYFAKMPWLALDYNETVANVGIPT